MTGSLNTNERLQHDFTGKRFPVNKTTTFACHDLQHLQVAVYLRLSLLAYIKNTVAISIMKAKGKKKTFAHTKKPGFLGKMWEWGWILLRRTPPCEPRIQTAFPDGPAAAHPGQEALEAEAVAAVGGCAVPGGDRH